MIHKASFLANNSFVSYNYLKCISEKKIMRTINCSPLLALLISSVAIAQGVHTWYGNAEFMQQLDTSIASFFGNSIGTYIRSDDYAHMNASDQMAHVRISNQFLSVFGHGIPGSRQLSNGEMLYTFTVPHDGYIRVAIVTPRYNTSVLAAAITHWTCGSLSMKDVHNASVVESNSKSARCNKPTVTVFFKNQAEVNSIIRKELVEWGVGVVLPACKLDVLHNQSTLEHKRFVAKYGRQPPPCNARYNVVTLNP